MRSATSSAPLPASRSATALYRYRFFASVRWCRHKDETTRSAPCIMSHQSSAASSNGCTATRPPKRAGTGGNRPPHRFRSVERQQGGARKALEQHIGEPTVPRADFDDPERVLRREGYDRDQRRHHLPPSRHRNLRDLAIRRRVLFAPLGHDRFPGELPVPSRHAVRKPDETAAVERPSALQHDADGFGIDAMFLDEDPRRQRLDRIIVEHGYRRLKDDRTAVEL